MLNKCVGFVAAIVLLLTFAVRTYALDDHVLVRPGDSQLSVTVEATPTGLLRFRMTRDLAKTPDLLRQAHLVVNSQESSIAECELAPVAGEAHVAYLFTLSRNSAAHSRFLLREFPKPRDSVLSLGGATLYEVRFVDFLPASAKPEQPIPAENSGTFRLRGSVVAPDGTPANEVRVLLTGVDGVVYRGKVTTPICEVATNEAGHFEIDRIPAGLTVANLHVLVTSWEGKPVSVEAQHPVTGRMRSTGSLKFGPLDKSFDAIQFQMKWRVPEPDRTGPEWTEYLKLSADMQQGLIEKRDAAPKFLELAKRYPKHSVGVHSLGMICSIFGSFAPGIPELDAARDEVLTLVTGEFIDHPELSIVLANSAIRHCDNSVYVRFEKMLRTVLDRSPHRIVRGHACFHLADFLEVRTWLKKMDDTQRAAVLAEAEQLKRRAVSEFGDVRHIALDVNLAELAGKWSPHAATGKTAPDITGRDADRGEFGLRDFRGKVVMLSFSANWCAPCRKLYPQERELVEKFKDRPFVLLGVNADSEIETLRKSIESGEITWRCWWDGDAGGPIAANYNVQQWPTTYILDHRGVVRRVLHGELTAGDESLLNDLIERATVAANSDSTLKGPQEDGTPKDQSAKSGGMLEDGVYPVATVDPAKPVGDSNPESFELPVLEVEGAEPGGTSTIRIVPTPLLRFNTLSHFDFKFEKNECTQIGFANTDELKSYTRDHVGSRLAVVVGNRVVTHHKIREAITTPTVRITCCTVGGGDHLHKHLKVLKLAVDEHRDTSPATWTIGQEVPSGSTQSASGSPSPVEKGAPSWLKDFRFKIKTFTFVRLRYDQPRNRWQTDYPDADTNFSKHVKKLTSLEVSDDSLALRITDPKLADHPFAYLSGNGTWQLTDEDAVALRRYFDRGGFLMIDDSWGDDEWRNVQAQMKKVFPDRQLTELPLEHKLFHCVYDLTERPQVCGIHYALAGRADGVTWERPDGKQVSYQGITDDKGRMVVLVCHNTDLADGWERVDDDEWYAREFSEKRAFPMGINILFHALTK